MAMTISGSNGVTYPDGTVQASGSQACKAWVNFNGTGTVAIRAAYNVSSITDLGTGSYTVNFTTALQDANYAVVGAVGPASAGGECVQITSLATTGATIATSNNLNGLLDRANVGIAIFR